MKDFPRIVLFAVVALGIALLSAGIANDSSSVPERLDVDGLHNVFRICDKLYSGSMPEGDKGFESLKILGIKTILSVDGAKPEVDRAKKQGLRYVHVPVGYNGITRGQAIQIAKAVCGLSGPFYIHCHHGKHRGPAAAAIARLCSDEKCHVEQALAVMRGAGTDPRYQGLFKSVREFQRPKTEDLSKSPHRCPRWPLLTA